MAWYLQVFLHLTSGPAGVLAVSVRVFIQPKLMHHTVSHLYKVQCPALQVSSLSLAIGLDLTSVADSPYFLWCVLKFLLTAKYLCLIPLSLTFLAAILHKNTVSCLWTCRLGHMDTDLVPGRVILTGR